MKKDNKTISRLSSTSFNSVDEYVTFILEQVIKEEEPEAGFTKEEEAEVRKRLRALGYID